MGKTVLNANGVIPVADILILVGVRVRLELGLNAGQFGGHGRNPGDRLRFPLFRHLAAACENANAVVGDAEVLRRVCTWTLLKESYNSTSTSKDGTIGRELEPSSCLSLSLRACITR